MPAKSLAITLFSLSNPLMSVLLPTFGRPTTDNYIGFFFIMFSLEIYAVLDEVYVPAEVSVSKGLMSLSESKSELSSGS